VGVAATPDLFRPDRRIAARAAGWRNDRHIARLGRWCANFRVNSCGRAEHAVGSCQFVAERLRSRVGGRGALRRDGALLRHRLRRRATRRIPRGRWRGRLSRWRRRRRRSLCGCRAGCHQSCQDQKKRLSLHGEQMLPRRGCSILAEKTDSAFGLPGPQDSFSVVAASPDTLPSQNASAASPEVLFALRQFHDVVGGVLESYELATAGHGDWIVERAFPVAIRHFVARRATSCPN
jgi:hypothetical protein